MPAPAKSPDGRRGRLDFSAVREDLKDHSRLALYQSNPGDSRWSPVTGPLGPALRLESVTPGASRLCTARFRFEGTGDARVHVAVPALTNGEGKNQTLTFEVSWFDANGPILVDGKGARAAVGVAQGDWRWVSLPMTPPPGADHAQLCLRFAKSTGTLEVDGLEAGGL